MDANDRSLDMNPGMTPEEREEVRRRRRAYDDDRREKAEAHAKTHPLTEKERSSLPVIRL